MYYDHTIQHLKDNIKPLLKEWLKGGLTQKIKSLSISIN